mmetsp:Transcript_25328/g.63514  ORF Transcript_25328/g.63514 Transcript_25328/m.63514 type:complete len:205 (+) Transcript_25328:1840-2454(+)
MIVNEGVTDVFSGKYSCQKTHSFHGCTRNTVTTICYIVDNKFDQLTRVSLFGSGHKTHDCSCLNGTCPYQRAIVLVLDENTKQLAGGLDEAGIHTTASSDDHQTHTLTGECLFFIGSLLYTSRQTIHERKRIFLDDILTIPIRECTAEALQCIDTDCATSFCQRVKCSTYSVRNLVTLFEVFGIGHGATRHSTRRRRWRQRRRL